MRFFVGAAVDAGFDAPLGVGDEDGLLVALDGGGDDELPVGGFDELEEEVARANLRGAMARGRREIQDQERDFGVDTGLIDTNLRLPVEERMRRHFERVRMYQRMQARTLTERERAALRKAQVDEAIRVWGSAVPK